MANKKEAVVEEVFEVTEPVAEPTLVKVKVVASFYDLKANDTLRKIGDVIEVDEERADYLVGRKLVVKGE